MSDPLEMFCKWELETPNNIFLRQPFSGRWKTWTYQQAGDEIRKIASAIKSLNFPQRSNIALLSKNCAHWIMADLAIMMSGNISVPLYPTLTAAVLRQILDHSEAKAIIIGKLDNFESQKGGIPPAIIRIGVNVYQIHEEINWESLIQRNAATRDHAVWNPDEVATIIYTSGTTGGPKGVMHSVGAFDAVLNVTRVDLGLPLHPRLFSYLPMSHIAERMGIEMYGLYSGAVFSFAESLEDFPRNLLETEPHLFFAVPRIWGKFQEKILEKIPAKKLSRLLSIPLVKSIIKKSIRKKLGLAKATHIYSGAAPISIDLLKWYDKLGITIFQAFGMTEDCVYSHFNRHGANRFGTVGQRLSGLQVKISPEGELRVKSPSIMKGYYKDPQQTSDAFDEDGFLRTGDIGEVDNDGYLTITGRIKDQFKTDKGKYISPTPIEVKLLANTDIEQVCVVGMGIPQPISLVVLSATGRAKSKAQIAQSLSDLLTQINPTLQKYERLEKAVVMLQDWSIENGLMTPTLKVKRNEVEKIHLPKYPKWYAMEGIVVWEQGVMTS
jgi:long-chain acyl-CoA synthetase